MIAMIVMVFPSTFTWSGLLPSRFELAQSFESLRARKILCASHLMAKINIFLNFTWISNSFGRPPQFGFQHGGGLVLLILTKCEINKWRGGACFNLEI
jgi:hypothetical protein